MSKAEAEYDTTTQTDSTCTLAIAIRETTKFHPGGVIIAESDISAAFLQNLLAQFKVQATVDEEGDLRIAEAFGPVVYISLDPNRHWINFRTSFELPSLNENERIIFVNQLSHSMAMAQFAPTDDGIGIGYYMYYKGGLIVDQFMAMAQRFGSLSCAVMRRCMTFSTQLNNQENKAFWGTIN